jgi:oxygen-independent coproporphyrinogen-3 oxidase
VILPPLSLYVHIPWCIKKCPYCDFNSHRAPTALPETAYVAALIGELERSVAAAAGRPLGSIFFGGGTPSLFSATAIGSVLTAAERLIGFAGDIEITLEANPGATEQARFSGYRAAGVNRLSIGVQSFDDTQLRRLGRVHGANEASAAVAMAQAAGFARINIDLMHGLPEQTASGALADLQCAIDSGADHISWYQLTLEPNTEFYSRPPLLPGEQALEAIAQRGHALLLESGFDHYEVSAYQRGGAARHNLNYWPFGDYLGIGAGAHAKLSAIENGQLTVRRRHNSRRPDDYLSRSDPLAAEQCIDRAELPLEFMLNALRLREGVAADLFSQRTGLELAAIEPQLAALRRQGLLEASAERLQTTPLGYRFLNSVVAAFDPA